MRMKRTETYPSFTYFFAGIIDEEDAKIEGIGLAFFLDLNLGIVYSIAGEEAPSLREQSAVSEAEVEALGRSSRLPSAEQNAGDGVASRRYDSRRRHFCVERERVVWLPQILTFDWLFELLSKFYINKTKTN